MKYIAACIMFLPGNEILSLFALTVILCMFIGDILKARMSL